MYTYMIEALDRDGNKQKKLVQVELEEDIFRFLEFSGLIPLKIKKVPEFYRYINIRKYLYRIKKQEIIEVLENLHLIVKSGIPVINGLMDIAEDTDNPLLKDMLLDMAYRVQMGYTLSRAFQIYENYFSSVVVSLVNIGEETGSLDKTLKDASEHLKKIEDIKAKTKQALIYPTFAFVSVFGALLFWLVYVLPKIIDAFKQFNITLPPTTIFIMYVSDFTRKYMVYFAVFLFIGGIIVKILRDKNEKFRYYTDKILLRLPVFGIILTNFNYAFFAEYIRLMIVSGIPLYQALYIMENASKNMVFKVAVKNTREKIEQGKSFSESLREEDVFSPLIIRMISIGEQAGRLDEQLEYISNYYYNKVDYLSQNIAKMIEPIVIGIVGGFMLVIMIGLVGPIYDLISEVSKM
ncbi:general secretion pathway protein F/type IV pilus assembly protein PilC [Persephonella hydrogeniphila]|uniref:General secretion pathway protein F/type IV pilus assembly protein PilC n=1 Tax=Persephonella hydrogeniphila TaxID=198703 RepID=A0A285N0C2_9AQUI|nr:type II secretion system F family protein [Persephonella hydrogeniphila]SNZ02904.1 general secretion pathway protein F/type IV pilus assembly protein PilC [Persephonella hydrogeniphila]